ncbi:MAG: sigma-54-dependent Fis family transcriptional regulator [Deltaproteobacteria bacterium]|nr:sigma-54-dependent Fis family transcriptional regulator [Deltaproteobacteria bacterium]
MVFLEEPHVTGAILIVEDEAPIRESLAEVLRADGHQVTCATDGVAAMAALDTQEFDLVLSDVRMPGADGLAVLKHAREVTPQAPVLMMTAYATLDTAVEALRRGAHDYLAKPLVFEDVQHKIRFLLRNRLMAWENTLLRAEVQRQWNPETLVSESPAMQAVVATVRGLAAGAGPVLITGERGAGKESIARAVHYFSRRRNSVFLSLHCAGVPEHELDGQLFGQRRGAIPGAGDSREGWLQRARGGTVFLNGLAVLPPRLQDKLLRVVEANEVIPVGGQSAVGIDVRIIAASNHDLQRAVEAGRFRADLYARVKSDTIEVPPLRERREDIPALAAHFVRLYSHEFRRHVQGIDATALQHLLRLPWPGNVRQLANVIEHAVLVGGGEWIMLRDLPVAAHVGEATCMLAPAASTLDDALRACEKAHIEATLAAAAHDKRAAAQRLGISLSSLYRKLASLGIALRGPTPSE